VVRCTRRMLVLPDVVPNDYATAPTGSLGQIEIPAPARRTVTSLSSRASSAGPSTTRWAATSPTTTSRRPCWRRKSTLDWILQWVRKPHMPFVDVPLGLMANVGPSAVVIGF